MSNSIEVNKREIADSLNRLIGEEDLDNDQKYLLADYIVENVYEILDELNYSDNAVVVDAEVSSKELI